VLRARDSQAPANREFKTGWSRLDTALGHPHAAEAVRSRCGQRNQADPWAGVKDQVVLLMRPVLMCPARAFFWQNDSSPCAGVQCVDTRRRRIVLLPAQVRPAEARATFAFHRSEINGVGF
jgi:hypothetical protein